VNIWEVPSYRIKISLFERIKDLCLGYKEGAIELNETFSTQPNDFLGLRKDFTPKKFFEFGVKAFKGRAKFLKECCNIMSSHIKSLCLEF